MKMDHTVTSDDTSRFPEVFTAVIVERFVFVRGMLN